MEVGAQRSEVCVMAENSCAPPFLQSCSFPKSSPLRIDLTESAHMCLRSRHPFSHQTVPMVKHPINGKKS
jgi:hypothetical protein